ncbi:MAG TPA: ABC transporter permease subunit [Chloroflexota bacterium]
MANSLAAVPAARLPKPIRLTLPRINPLLLVACVPAALIVGLLGLTVWISFQVDVVFPSPTLDNYLKLYTDSFAYTALLNTLGFALVTLSVALLIGVPLAWVAERTDLPGKGVIGTVIPLGLLIPGFVGAMGWILLFSPRIGVVNTMLKGLTGAARAPIDITTVPGMGVVLGLGLASLVFVFVSGSLRAMDPSLEESATMSGGGFLTTVRKVTLPLAWPGIIAAALFTFTIGLSTLDIPLVIGQSNKVYTFSTYLLSQTNPQSGTPQYGLTAAFSTFMIGLALLLAWWYGRMLRQARKYQVVGGKNYRPRLTHLGWWTAPVWLTISLYFLLAHILPLLMLLWASLIPFFQPPSVRAFQTISATGYTSISWGDLTDGLKHTVILMVGVPTLTLSLSLAFSWVVLRTRYRCRLALDSIAFIANAIPSVIWGFGALVVSLFFIKWPPNLYRSLGLLLIVMVIFTLSFGTRMTNAALIQVHTELEEAGFASGASLQQVFRRVLLPLLRPTLTYSWLWIALLVYRDLSLPTLLFSRDDQTMSVVIWNLWSRGITDQASAITMVMVALSIPLIAVFWRARGGVQYIG